MSCFNLGEDDLLEYMIEDTRWHVAYYGKYVRRLPKDSETYYHKQYRIGQQILKALLEIEERR